MSDDIVIRAENVSKRYQLSHLPAEGTLRDTVHQAARLAWRRLRWKTPLNREEFWALRDVNFDIKRGEVVGIIGRNGAGKSTLLKILSRITEPTTGRITLRGRVASLLEVGTGFHPELSGRDNIFLNGAILGMTRVEIRQKFDEIVAFAEVERFLDTPVKRYSSGMYVRLAFAVAAHLEPEILIVDEVLAVGDAEFQKKCLGKMEQVAGTGRTVIFVSHNMTAMGQLCGRCIHLEKGTVKAQGPSARIIEDYLRPESTTDATATLHCTKSHPEVEITGVDVVVDGRPARTVTAGSTVDLSLTYRCRNPGAFASGFEASFILWARGQKLVNFWSNAGRGSSFPTQSEGRITCRVPRWPFRNVTLHLETHLSYRFENLVEIPVAAVIETIDGDFYGRGVIPHHAEGNMLLDHTWSTDDPVS